MASAGRVLPLSKGSWESGKVYEPLDCVYYQGSTYICKATATGSTVSPDKDTAHWQLQAQGFGSEFISDTLTEDTDKVPSDKAVSDAIKPTALKVTDTAGIIDGTEKKSTFLQTFLDKVGDWIINKAMTNEAFTQKLADNLVTTEDGFALDAKQGKALADKITALNESLTNDYGVTVSNNLIAGEQTLSFEWSEYSILSFNCNNYNNYSESVIVPKDEFKNFTAGTRAILTNENMIIQIYPKNEQSITIKCGGTIQSNMKVKANGFIKNKYIIED